MNIWFKLLLTPLVAFILMIITVGIMGSFFEYAWIKENLPSGLPVWIAWQIILVVLLVGKQLRNNNE